MSIHRFSDKTPSETVEITFDFSNLFVVAQGGIIQPIVIPNSTLAGMSSSPISSGALSGESSTISSQISNPIETIISTVWSVMVLSGTDVNPNALFVTPNGTFKDAVVSTLIKGGNNQTQYLITCVATTSVGQVLTKSGIIAVLQSSTTSTISSRQDLADYCLRKLGGGVVNVEISDDQVNDCIEDAIAYYHEYHFDGIERDYIVYRIQGSQITLASTAGFRAGDSIIGPDNITQALVAAVNGNTCITNRQIGYNKFNIGDTVKSQATGAITTVTGIVLGDPDNGYIQTDSSIVGVKRILNITSILGSADYMFNVQYQIMMSEIQNLTSAGTAYFYSVQQFLGHLDFIMKKEKDFRFNRRMDRLYLDISWGLDVRVGDIVVAEVYRALDPEQFTAVYSDIWVRRYSTALMKKQQGINLKKYAGMELPGGVKFDAQAVYNEAIADIEKLENEAIYSTSPLLFDVG